MKTLKEIIKMLEILTEAFKDIKTETLEDAVYLTDDIHLEAKLNLHY